MSSASLNVQVEADLRRDVDILATIRDMTVRSYVEEALLALVARDKANNAVAYQAFLEIRRQMDQEVQKLRKTA